MIQPTSPVVQELLLARQHVRRHTPSVPHDHLAYLSLTFPTEPRNLAPLGSLGSSGTHMCRHPAILAPLSGWVLPNFSRRYMRPGISCSASSISLRPKAAREMSATL